MVCQQFLLEFPKSYLRPPSWVTCDLVPEMRLYAACFLRAAGHVVADPLFRQRKNTSAAQKNAPAMVRIAGARRVPVCRSESGSWLGWSKEKPVTHKIAY